MFKNKKRLISALMIAPTLLAPLSVVACGDLTKKQDQKLSNLVSEIKSVKYKDAPKITSGSVTDSEPISNFNFGVDVPEDVMVKYDILSRNNEEGTLKVLFTFTRNGVDEVFVKTISGFYSKHTIETQKELNDLLATITTVDYAKKSTILASELGTDKELTTDVTLPADVEIEYTVSDVDDASGKLIATITLVKEGVKSTKTSSYEISSFMTTDQKAQNELNDLADGLKSAQCSDNALEAKDFTTDQADKLLFVPALPEGVTTSYEIVSTDNAKGSAVINVILHKNGKESVLKQIQVVGFKSEAKEKQAQLDAIVNGWKSITFNNAKNMMADEFIEGLNQNNFTIDPVLDYDNNKYTVVYTIDSKDAVNHTVTATFKLLENVQEGTLKGQIIESNASKQFVLEGFVDAETRAKDELDNIVNAVFENKENTLPSEFKIGTKLSWVLAPEYYNAGGRLTFGKIDYASIPATTDNDEKGELLVIVNITYQNGDKETKIRKTLTITGFKTTNEANEKSNANAENSSNESSDSANTTESN